LPGEVKREVRKHPDEYAFVVLAVKMMKRMPFPVLDLWFGALDDQEIWCESKNDRVTDDNFPFVHFPQDGTYYFKVFCVVKTEKISAEAVLEKLRGSSMSAYYSTGGVGDLYNEEGGLVRFGPVFAEKLDFSAATSFTNE
jgi:hypothetical protein